LRSAWSASVTDQTERPSSRDEAKAICESSGDHDGM
jgi:hypothetical protein